MNKITNIKQNCMGTLDFDGKFNGMKKSQDFIVYPMHKDNATDKIMIQSNTRIGYIYLESGDIVMSPSRSGGSYSVHLIFARKIDQIDKEELAGFKFRLVQTAGEKVGSNRMNIFTDNSNAEKVSIFSEVTK